MTYNVFSGTLNRAQSINQTWSRDSEEKGADTDDSREPPRSVQTGPSPTDDSTSDRLDRRLGASIASSGSELIHGSQPPPPPADGAPLSEHTRRAG